MRPAIKMTISNLTSASVYVGTYRKYNEGSIFGKWLNLSDYTDKDDFLSDCAKLHNDEKDPEFMFQDHEYISDCFISESDISEKIFELIDRINEISNIEAFESYIDYMGYDFENQNFEEIKDKFEESFCGEYNNEIDFAYEIMEECYNLEGIAAQYFDYDSFSRDLFICDYSFSNGFVFRNL